MMLYNNCVIVVALQKKLGSISEKSQKSFAFSLGLH